MPESSHRRQIYRWDFIVNGNGSNANCQNSQWHWLTMASKLKSVFSAVGIMPFYYIIMHFYFGRKKRLLQTNEIERIEKIFLMIILIRQLEKRPLQSSLRLRKKLFIPLHAPIFKLKNMEKKHDVDKKNSFGCRLAVNKSPWVNVRITIRWTMSEKRTSWNNYVTGFDSPQGHDPHRDTCNSEDRKGCLCT